MNILVPLTGLLMALADTMPGLSGGTICFIMGYYDQFLTSIKNLLHKETRKDAFKFLLTMGSGWIVGLLVGILVINKLLAMHPYMMISFFLGLVLISIPMTFKSEVKYLKQWQNFCWAIIGVCIVVFITNGADFDLALGQTYPVSFYIYTFIVSMLAICAMLLPGISGSTVLLIFGIYQIVLNNVKLVLTNFNLQSLMVVLTVVIGVLIGAILISKSISNAFKHHRSKVLYLILGLMIGSLYAIWQSPQALEGIDGGVIAPFNLSLFNLPAFLLGICAIIVIEIVKTKLNKNQGA